MAVERAAEDVFPEGRLYRRRGLAFVLSWARQHVLHSLGITMTALVVAVALLAPLISPHDPTLQDSKIRLSPPAWAEEGSAEFPLGADNLGRDLLSRIFYGARVSLIVGICAVLLAGLFGVVLGLLSGYLEGRFETLIMGIADAQLAFPSVLLAIAIIAILGPSFGNVLLVLTISGWVIFARLVRGTTLSVKQTDFILASRSVGAPDYRIIFRHILPHVVTPVIAVANIQVGQMILAESALSFLGLGVQPPTPTWGGMISDGRVYIWQAPWLSVFPGMAIVFTVLGITYLGDWLRIVLDPKY